MNPSPKEIHLLDYWRILAKRRWVLLTTLIVVISTVTLSSILKEPKYTASARLQIELNAPNVLPFQDMVTRADYRKDFYDTQYILIQSRRVTRDAVRSLRLNRYPEFRVKTEADPARGLTAKEVAESTQVNMLLDRLEVSPVRGSRLVDISFTCRDPVLAAKVANRIAETYIAFNSEASYNTSERATASLAHQIANLQEEIDAKEEDLQAYARKHGIIPLSENQNITLKNLNDLNSSSTKAQANRIEKEARYMALRESDPGSLVEVIENKLIQDLTAMMANLERQAAKLSEKYKPEWPEMARLNRELEETHRRLRDERRTLFAQVVGAARGAYEGARKEEGYLATALAKLKKEYQDLNLKEIQYNNLRADVANRRSTLEALVKRESETSSTIGMHDPAAGNVRIVDPAEVPISPSSPRILLNFLLSLFIGLGLGIGGAFFLEYFDMSVKGPEDFQEAAGVPCIGLIPVMHSATGLLRQVAARRRNSNHVPPVELISHEDMQSKVSEAFREIRTSLLVSRAGGPPRVILITSSQPGEGKTVVALNLAITLAQIGRRVLLVDADLRKPRIHKLLGIKGGKGLTHYLSGAGPFRPQPVATRVPGLEVIPSGPLPPNPADLLDSERFLQVLREFETIGFDHILFDSPPLLAVADPCILASRVNAVIMVVGTGTTSRETVSHAMRRLEQVKAPVVGGILNRVDFSQQNYYGHNYHQYYLESGETGAPGE